MTEGKQAPTVRLRYDGPRRVVHVWGVGAVRVGETIEVLPERAAELAALPVIRFSRVDPPEEIPVETGEIDGQPGEGVVESGFLPDPDDGVPLDDPPPAKRRK